MSSLEALDEITKRDPGAVRGKIVFFNKIMPKSREDFAGYGEAVPLRVYGAARAAQHGASGVLIRSVGTSNNRLAHTGSLRYEEGMPKIPAAALSTPDAALLSRLGALGGPIRVRFQLVCGSKPDAQSANVIAEIPGRRKPEDVVVLSGHLDSWDLGTGAIDDGTGCAIAIEAARIIGRQARKPLRSIRVVLFANEENGLAGAITYARNHKAEIPRHAAALEIDSGTGRAIGLNWNGGVNGRALMEEMKKLMLPLDATMFEEGGAGGADLSVFKDTDIPLFGLRQDLTTYFDYHHTANDTFDKVDPAALKKSTAFAAAWAYTVADLPGSFPRGRNDKK